MTSATDELRRLLDERGVEWREWTKGQVETQWFVPSGMTEFDSHFCSASVSRDHREGPLHYKGYVISPQAAIEASLGKTDNASAVAGDINELRELRDLACDIHAAEIIDHVHITHRGWTFDSQWLDLWHTEFDRIADKLEQAIAAWNTRAERTCRNTDDDCDAWFECSECGLHSKLEIMSGGYGIPNYCPNCGARVVS